MASAYQIRQRAIKNELQEQKRTERLGRRAYRAALRGNDPSAYLRGLEALERTRAINGSSGAGIKTAGLAEDNIVQGIEQTGLQLSNFNGKVSPAATSQPRRSTLQTPDSRDVPTNPRPGGPLVNAVTGADSVIGTGAFNDGNRSSMGWVDLSKRSQTPTSNPVEQNTPGAPVVPGQTINSTTGMPMGTLPGDSTYNPQLNPLFVGPPSAASGFVGPARPWSPLTQQDRTAIRDVGQAMTLLESLRPSLGSAPSSPPGPLTTAVQQPVAPASNSVASTQSEAPKTLQQEVDDVTKSRQSRRFWQ